MITYTMGLYAGPLWHVLFIILLSDYYFKIQLLFLNRINSLYLLKVDMYTKILP